MLWHLSWLLPFAAAVPNLVLFARHNATLQGQFCELGGVISSDSNETTATCNDCVTVSGIAAPTTTPTVTSNDTVNGAADADSIFSRRAPTEVTPLLGLEDFDGPDDQTRMIQLFSALVQRVPEDSNNDIPISPRDVQVQTWTIDGTPVGATGFWYDFGDTPQTWRMRDLSGCTAIVILSSKGFWAGHLWESTSVGKNNGASAFLRRMNDDEVTLRTADEFQKIAINILTQITPPDQASNRDFISLEDLKTTHGDPFADSDDVNVYVLTRARSAGDPTPRYKDKIGALNKGLKAAVSPGRGQSNYATYPGLGDVDKNGKYPASNGEFVLEYSPFAALEDGCTKKAAANLWLNLGSQTTPAITKPWDAPDDQQMSKRDICAVPSPANSSTPIASFANASAPIPSCTLQQQDPDEGITTRYCVCEQSRTLPLLTISTPVSLDQSCSYTTLPPTNARREVASTTPPSVAHPAGITQSATLQNRDLNITKGFGSATTDLAHCQVCSQIVINEDSCSSLQSCVVETGAVTVEAGSSVVHVGTVTGTALYTSVSSAVDKICPTPTSGSFTACGTQSAAVSGVPYVDSGFLATDGEILVTVEASAYNDTGAREAMIKTIAVAVQNAATSTNCYTAKYDVEQITRRWLDYPMALFRRDHSIPEPESATWCNTVGFTGPQYYNPWWRLAPSPGASDYINAHLEFHEPPGGDFSCEVLQEAADALAFIQPEFTVADVELGEAIEIACECLEGGDCPSSKRDLDNINMVAR